MFFKRIAIALISAVLALTAFSGKKSSGAEEATASNVLDFTMKNIDGVDVPLSNYKGKVLLFVNVASKCGFTPQYDQLSALKTKYAEKGFEILGFPANNFLHQEPGSDAEIKVFCQTTYKVNFDLFSKISVGGRDIHPLYRFLTDKKTNPKFSGRIKWNFEKFLIGRDGQVIDRFGPSVTPDADEVIKAVEAALATTTK